MGLKIAGKFTEFYKWRAKIFGRDYIKT